MKFYQEWEGRIECVGQEFFPVKVPGNIQDDYAQYHEYGDVNFGYNCERYRWMEEYGCTYRTKLSYQLGSGEKLFFVSKGIDYEYEVFLNGKCILVREGMFSQVEIDITEHLTEQNILEVKIRKPPKAQVDEKEKNSRAEVREAVKPAVSYGWDLHPRIIPTGIWDDTYLESRGTGYINHCEVMYHLNEELTAADVSFQIECRKTCLVELFAPDGTCIYRGHETAFQVKNPLLWWCNGQGKPYLYSYSVRSEDDMKTGWIGFRKVELVMNKGAWEEPRKFPKTRSVPPITLKLNGREIFAKGTNWVSPEIFFGRINEDSYEPLIRLAQAAHMNIFRCWGGTIVNKDVFFDLCDRYGIMVWQEFPLACNRYSESEKYLSVLKEEAVSIVKRLCRHPSHVLWCGGNELFNEWSGMTEQSPALRLLNAVCYEYDREKPFIMTSPIMGMGHGYYMFYDSWGDKDIFQIINASRCTAYTEFGVPSLTTPEIIERIIPEHEREQMNPGTAWEIHHAFGAWEADSWCAKKTVEKYFGRQESVKEFAEKTWLLQGEGLKAVFEEARRQRPYCSMAISWDYNEPWYTAAGSNIVTYDAKPKPSYYAVQAALRPVLASARVYRFEYFHGEEFEAQIWLLNDSVCSVEEEIKAFLVMDGREEFLMEWHTGTVSANTNKRGHTIHYKLPEVHERTFSLVLRTKSGNDSLYTFAIRAKEDRSVKRVLN